jgi:nitrogenase molybdenum-cofactor synthesis protein NifE
MPRPDWYDAPECDAPVEKGAPKFCKRSEPGEGTERSCAFDGARVVLMPITDAIHLVHGPIACAGNSWDNRGARSSGSQLYRRGFTTEVLHNDVVFGGEAKLRRAILDLSARYAGEARAVFVYATCVTAMTGDDVEAVCRAVQPEVPIPVIPVNTPGFVGDKNIGNRLAGELLLEHVIGTAEPAVRTDYDVNLIGEYNIAGDLWGMLPLFARVGIRVLSCISGDARFDELRHAHRARLNVIVCSKSLTNLARKMRRRWGIPFLDASFYGMTDTARALRDMARELDASKGPAEHALRDRVEALVGEEEARCRLRLAPHRARLSGKRAVLFTGGVKTWSMVNALRELGVEVLAAGTQNSTLEDFHRMKALLHPDAGIIEDTSTKGLLAVVREKRPDLIVAGGKTKFLALKTRTPFLDINHGRSHPYAGYEGMVTFARQLDLTVNSPIWPALSSAAPWDAPAPGAAPAAALAPARGHGAALQAEDLRTSRVAVPAKAATVNPQKNSPALGATLAFLGVDGMLGLLHGAQGCSTFIRLQLSRHFKESIALNSTAMTEDAAVFGGWQNLAQGIRRVIEKFRPGVVGVMTSGLTETMGDDVRSAVARFREEHPELAATPVVWASTPDYAGSLQEGYAAAVDALLGLAEGGEPLHRQINLLPGAHLTPGDVEELKQLVASFGLVPLCVPDLSTALDGYLDAEVTPLAQGGVTLEAIRTAGRSAATIYVGDSLARAARRLEEAHGVPALGFTSATGLSEVDGLVGALSALSGRAPPPGARRWRGRLLDAMADCHTQLGGKRVALALEADHLKGMVRFLAGMGCEVQAAVAATRTRGLDALPCPDVFVGDLEDLERVAAGADLVVANSNGRQAVARLGVGAHLRTGLPVFDRLGAHQKVWVGYRGTMNLVFEVANLLQAGATEAQKLAHN